MAALAATVDGSEELIRNGEKSVYVVLLSARKQLELDHLDFVCANSRILLLTAI